MDSWWRDISFGVRMLLRKPGFTAVAALSIAVGIAANATVFSWIQVFLLNPMGSVTREHELVTLETLTPSGQFMDSSYPDFRDYQDTAKKLSGVLAFHDRPLNLGDGPGSSPVWAEFVSGNFFEVLGVQPAAGRFFSAEEQQEKPGAHPVAVISGALWQSRFGSDRSMVGRTILLNRQKITVIGVTPVEFRGTAFGLRVDVYLPLMMLQQVSGGRYWLDHRPSRGLHLMARLAPGASLAEARAEIQAIARRLAAAYPDSNQGVGATLLPVWKAPYGAQNVLSGVLLVLMGVSAVVLLIVCANVANLLLARATGRAREISVRLALGAGRFRLVRQMLMESLLLSLVGGACGILMTFWFVDFLRALVPPTHLPVQLTIGLNAWVFVFAIALSVFAGLVFGLVPALQASRPDLNQSLREGGRGGSGGRGARRLRGLLVVSEMALALVTLVGAGLFVKSFHAARQMDVGFNPRNVLLLGMNLGMTGHTREQGLEFQQRLRSRVEALPGVELAAFAEDVPLGFEGGSWETLAIDGYIPQPSENMRIYRNLVGPGYFRLMGIPMLEGREFTEQDDERAPLSAIVNQTFVQRFFAGANPVGRTFRGWGRPLTIVGVARDSKYAALAEKPQPYFYVPFAQFYRADTGMALHIRTAGPPEALAAAVRAQVQAVDANVPTLLLPLEQFIGAAYFIQKTAATLLGALGSLALLLASLGLYSVMAYSVSQRTHEIGVRMALGAQGRDILRLVLGHGLRLTLVGLAVGAGVALAFVQVLSSVLLGVAPTDPLIFAAAGAVLLLVGVGACYLPARRAMAVSPMTALRYE